MQLIETYGPGGAEHMLARLSHELKLRDVDIVACILKEGWLADELRRLGIDVVVLPLRHGGDLQWLLRAARLVRELRVDLLHTHEFTMNAYGALLSLLCRIPCVSTVHGGTYHGEKWRRRFAYRLASRRAQFVAVSRDAAEFLVQTVGLNSGDVAVIHNGVSTEGYAPSEEMRLRTRTELGLEPDDIAVGAVGSLYPVKGHIYFARAVARIVNEFPRARFFIAGRGEMRAQLQKEIDDHSMGDRFKLLGFRENVSDLLRALDIYVMPSLNDGTPLALLEAMAAGKPIIASRVGGIPEVTGDQAALLVAPGSVDSLANSMRSLIGNPDLRVSYADTALRRVRASFSLEDMVTAYLHTYRLASGA